MHSHRIPIQFPDIGFIHSDIPVLDNDFDIFDLENLQADDLEEETEKDDAYDDQQ